MSTPTRAERLCLAAAVCAGLFLRLLVLVNAPAIELDGISYATMAEEFAHGHFGRALHSVFPPLYPLVTGLFHLAIPDVELAGRLSSLAVGMVLIYVSFRFAKRVLGRTDKAVWLAFLVAFQPYLVRYSGQVLSESLATLLFTVTVLAFYQGWQEGRRSPLVISGFCLALTYLTRPEYLVFYAPFILLLGMRRRILDSLLVLLPFIALGSLYICYLRLQTGVWTVSGKASLSPFVAVGAFFGNVPLVAYEFFIALFPLFFLFAIFGFRRVAAPYGRLVLLLVIFHVASLSFVSHATRRYSVEFVPLCMIISVEGIYAVSGYLRRFFPRYPVSLALVAVIVCSTVFQSFAPPHPGRGFHKSAGLFLLKHDPGSVVAARLPLAAFYEKGRSVDLLSEMSGERNMARFRSIVSEKRVKYLIFDEEMEKELPFLSDYLSKYVPVCAFRDKDAFVRVYGLS